MWLEKTFPSRAVDCLIPNQSINKTYNLLNLQVRNQTEKIRTECNLRKRLVCVFPRITQLKAQSIQAPGFCFIIASVHCSLLSEPAMFKLRRIMFLNFCLCMWPLQYVFCMLCSWTPNIVTLATQLGLFLSCILPARTATCWQIFLKL